MADAQGPTTPNRTGGPAEGSEHRKLYEDIIDAIHALPERFQSDLALRGILTTDLYTLASALGASIEQSVVDNLNLLRSVWDPEERYHAYQFVRQPQVFPDVRLENRHGQVLMGIELKGWFSLAKEGEPSFRYLVNADVCASVDLLVVFPWILSEVISGVPKLMMPYVEEAQYAAQQRNHYWTVGRGRTGEDAEIILAEFRENYPKKNDKFNDAARKDSGNNFGRVSRSGIMSDFIATMMQQPISGIPLYAWHKFLKIFSDQQTDENVAKVLAAMEREFGPQIAAREEVKVAFEKLRESAVNLMQTLK